jgi:hypothetical protein
LGISTRRRKKIGTINGKTFIKRLNRSENAAALDGWGHMRPSLIPFHPIRFSNNFPENYKMKNMLEK